MLSNISEYWIHLHRVESSSVMGWYLCEMDFAEEIPDFVRTWEEHEKMLPRSNKTRPLGIGSSYNGGMSPPLRGEFENLYLEARKRGNYR